MVRMQGVYRGVELIAVFRAYHQAESYIMPKTFQALDDMLSSVEKYGASLRWAIKPINVTVREVGEEDA